MKVPNHIETLTELSKWIKIYHPEYIIIIEGSPISSIWGFNKETNGTNDGRIKRWNTYSGIPVIYKS